MNAVEIEEAVSELAGRPFDPAEFPYAFLRAFGNKETTIKRLRSGQSNASDIPGGVLQRSNIHIAVCTDAMVTRTLVALRESANTTAAKAKFVLATDGVTLEAEELATGETIAPLYKDFAKHFGFFLPLGGISTVKEIKNNPFDIKATGRLNKLYVELLKDNPDWATEAKRPALNQFIARLIFCFFAEDTGIFLPKQFTKTLEQMSDGQSGNTNAVLCELFRAMDLKSQERESAKVKNWASVFPYVNGGMFAGGAECPRFSRLARTYLLHVGNLEWDKINPDIFGSMIQAVADDDERREIGMHYTSVPNILKVLNPLFLDDLREHLKIADDNVRKLRNLRKRLSAIRVFDPACGSGNFLVIAYKEMRAIEHEIVCRTGDEPKSWIKLDNFYGIEIRNFAVEIARLALLIAEFQCDVQYISQQEARAMVLPLHRTGQIQVKNALTLDWLEVCAPLARAVANANLPFRRLIYSLALTNHPST
jgi:N-6 DNA Methylase